MASGNLKLLSVMLLIWLVIDTCRTGEPPGEGDAKPANTPVEKPDGKEGESVKKDNNDTNAADANKTPGADQTDGDGNGETVSTFNDLLNKNSDMLKRAMYVTIAVTGILMLYFAIRFIRSRKRKVRRYGLLAKSGNNVEMEPLASDSDEDMTVFDARRNLVQ